MNRITQLVLPVVVQGCSYNFSFGGKSNSIISVLRSYLAFAKRNGVLENTLAGPSVTAGKTSLS